MLSVVVEVLCDSIKLLATVELPTPLGVTTTHHSLNQQASSYSPKPATMDQIIMLEMRLVSYLSSDARWDECWSIREIGARLAQEHITDGESTRSKCVDDVRVAH